MLPGPKPACGRRAGEGLALVCMGSDLTAMSGGLASLHPQGQKPVVESGAASPSQGLWGLKINLFPDDGLCIESSDSLDTLVGGGRSCFQRARMMASLALPTSPCLLTALTQAAQRIGLWVPVVGVGTGRAGATGWLLPFSGWTEGLLLSVPSPNPFLPCASCSSRATLPCCCPH